MFEVICARFIELHKTAHTVKWRDIERLMGTYAVPPWRGRPIGQIDRASAHALLDDIAM